MWNFLEIQRLRFVEELLTGAPLTQEQQQQPYEVHGNLEVPGIQDPIRGWEGPEVVVKNFLTSDPGVHTVSPMGTSETDTNPTSPNILG